MNTHFPTTDLMMIDTVMKTAPEINKEADLKKLRQAVEEFEAFFISQTFAQMYDTIPVNETFGGGNAEKIFRSMLIDEYGKMTARSGGIGLTDQIMTQILIQQEADTTANNKTIEPQGD